MNNREMLYRTALMHGASTATESPCLPVKDLSPMSSLAHHFHNNACLSNTPRRKLSLNSTTSSDSSHSSHESSFQSSSMLHESVNSECKDDSTLMSPPTSCLLSPSRKIMSRNKENFPSPCHEDSTLMSPPSNSPSRKMLARDKENFHSPYFSPSHSTHIPHRPRSSPLQDVQNTVNRNLSFSPMKKKLQMISPTKRVLASPHKPSPPDDSDTNSQDSGYSESGKKFEDTCFSVPVNCAPRKLNLDLSPPRTHVHTSSKAALTTVNTSSLTVISTSPKAQDVLSPKAALTTVNNSALTVTAVTTAATTMEDRKPFRRFSSLNKGDEEDTMLMDLMNDFPSPEEQHPLGFKNLLLAPIQTSKALTFQPSITPCSRPAIKRCLSMMDITPTTSRVECVTSSPIKQCANVKYGRFKRPEAPADLSNLVECKRRKEDNCCRTLSPLDANAPTSVKTISPLTQRQASAPETSCTQIPKLKIVRSHSESHVSIMKALNKCSNHNGELIGDFSKPILLPTIEGGKHPDLKAIHVDTMADLIKGKYAELVSSFRIVDCRYPYEYEGGHINGAEMFYHPKMIIDHLMAQKGTPVITKEETPREILIFHCEFSAERGPKAQRLLRENDRTTNKEHYPALHFPETYLLEGGYKAFFEKYPEFCTPRSYVRMLDPCHADDLKHFRGRSKSWQAENKQSKSRNTAPRTGLKRLGL